MPTLPVQSLQQKVITKPCETKSVGSFCLIKIHVLGSESTHYDSWTQPFIGRQFSNCFQPTGRLIRSHKGNHLSNLLARAAMRANRNKMWREKKRGQFRLYLIRRWKIRAAVFPWVDSQKQSPNPNICTLLGYKDSKCNSSFCKDLRECRALFIYLSS